MSMALTHEVDLKAVKDRRSRFLEEFYGLCSKWDLAIVPSYGGKVSCHDPLIITELDPFLSDYILTRTQSDEPEPDPELPTRICPTCDGNGSYITPDENGNAKQEQCPDCFGIDWK